MKLAKKILLATVALLISTAGMQPAAAQTALSPLRTTDAILNKGLPFCLGVEVAFVDHYFSANGSEMHVSGMNPGFAVNMLAEANLGLQGSLLLTVEPGIIVTSGKYDLTFLHITANMKKSIVDLNVPITIKYRVYDIARTDFFVQVGIAPGFVLSQSDEVLKTINSEIEVQSDDEMLDVLKKGQNSFYLGGMVGVGADFDILPVGSLQARITWEPTFTSLQTLGKDGENLKQNFFTFGIAYKFCK